MKLIEEPYAVVEVKQGLKTLEVTWDGHPKSEHYRDVLLRGIAFIKAYELTHWLTDMTHSQPVGVTDRKWTEDEVVPNAFEAGIRKAAFVLPRNAFVKYYSDKLKEKFEALDVPVKYFGSKAEAAYWMNQDYGKAATVIDV